MLSVTKPALEAATPVIKDAAFKVYEFAAPVASEGFERAQKALSEAGVDTTPVIQAAKVRARIHTHVSVETEDRNGVTLHSAMDSEEGEDEEKDVCMVRGSVGRRVGNKLRFEGGLSGKPEEGKPEFESNCFENVRV